jgi:hypothetical protein
MYEPVNRQGVWRIRPNKELREEYESAALAADTGVVGL